MRTTSNIVGPWYKQPNFRKLSDMWEDTYNTKSHNGSIMAHDNTFSVNKSHTLLVDRKSTHAVPERVISSAFS